MENRSFVFSVCCILVLPVHTVNSLIQDYILK
jgi:hypothetical protein